MDVCSLTGMRKLDLRGINFVRPSADAFYTLNFLGLSNAKVPSLRTRSSSFYFCNYLDVLACKSHTKHRSTSSWYTDNDMYQSHKCIPENKSTCWYAEVGLYPEKSQNVMNSTNETDSFCSSISSTITEDTPSEYYNCNIKQQQYVKLSEDPSTKIDDLQLTFQDEPLYQFYTEEKVKSGVRIMRSNSWTEDYDSDGYEQIGEKACSPNRPSAMQLIRPSSPGHTRTLWCEVPQVVSSRILDTLTLQQKKVQEAKFELITSEASYLNSLNVLSTHFIQTIQREKLLPEEDQTIVFAFVEPGNLAF